MGYYVNRLPDGKLIEGIDKAHSLLKYAKAVEIDVIKKFEDIPEGIGMVCVVNNMFFDAALVCVNQKEIDMIQVDDGRKKRYFLLDKNYLEKEIGVKF